MKLKLIDEDEQLSKRGRAMGYSFRPLGMGGGVVVAQEPEGEEDMTIATLTLNNAQIKAAGTPYTLVASTQTLGYVGTPTQVFVPIEAFVKLNTASGAYTNVDAALKFVVAWGSDWSFDVIRMAASMGTGTAKVYRFGDSDYLTLNTNTPAEGVAHKHQLTYLDAAELNGNLQDNALVFVISNGGSGALTGGHANNSMTITVVYYTVTL